MHLQIQAELLSILIFHREREEISAHDFYEIGKPLLHAIVNSPEKHRLNETWIHMIDRDMKPDAENPGFGTPRSDDRRATYSEATPFIPSLET